MHLGKIISHCVWLYFNVSHWLNRYPHYYFQVRKFLYILAGFLAGLLGTLAGQILLPALAPIYINLPDVLSRPEFILFPIASTSLAIAMVAAEIFLNNPTRLKANWQVLSQPILRATMLGIGSGLVAALLSVIVGNNTSIGADFLKLMGWMLIGAGAGAADGYSWQFRTIEGRQKQRARQRFIKSTLAGAGAGFVAFFLSKPLSSSALGELVGFVILGVVLGIVLSQTAAASLCFALRAGSGFEPDDYDYNFPRITSNELNFNFTPNISKPGYERRIEEGISIELPNQGTITIGSDRNSNIYVSTLPSQCAQLKIDNRKVELTAQSNNCVMVNRKTLNINLSEELKHNQILTFINSTKDENQVKPSFVRFVFYDRFLDPQA